MRVLVTASAHFVITPEGALWTPNASLSYRFWRRYLEVFDAVELMVRAELRPEAPNGWNLATGAAVAALPVPEFVGPWGFVRNYAQVARVARRALAGAQAILLRVPCAIGEALWRMLPPGRPFGVEVVGDPNDVFAPGSVRHPLRRFFRWWFTRQLQRQCRAACAAAYVTMEALQRRYACPAYSVGFSDVELPNESFAANPRPRCVSGRPLTLITVGSQAQLYKAPDVLIDATARAVRAGRDLRLVLVGDGKYRSDLEARAASWKLDNRVQFRGHLPAGDAIRRELDQADLFVLPSHQEGMPKAMIEAMARALPCIGSTVGGFPELLEPEEMVPPGDAAALAQKILQITADPDRLVRMSARNLMKAREYREEILGERRRAFYRIVREKTKFKTAP